MSARCFDGSYVVRRIIVSLRPMALTMAFAVVAGTAILIGVPVGNVGVNWGRPKWTKPFAAASIIMSLASWPLADWLLNLALSRTGVILAD